MNAASASHRPPTHATAAAGHDSPRARLAAAVDAAAAPARRRDGAADRAYWLTVATRLADPVLVNLAERQAARADAGRGGAGPGVREGRAKVSHLEAFGRLLCGIAPWLELAPDDSSEGRLRAKYRDLAVKALAAAVDPASPDRLNFTDGAQALVDAAFLSQAILARRRRCGERRRGDARSRRQGAGIDARAARPASTTGCCSRRRSKRR